MLNSKRKAMVSRFMAGVVGTAIALSVSSAMAQTEPTEESDDDQALEEIVVTAQRRTEDLQDAALSISVRDGDLLKQEGKFTLEQVLEGVPGVGITSTRGSGGAGTDNPGNAIVVRGIPSNNALGGTVISSVAATATYVDGVYNGVGGDYDLEQIEILRGPQGTLYGRSATAGVVTTHTSNPELGIAGGNFTAEIGTDNLLRASAAANVPLGDSLAIRISGLHFERDGYYAKKGEAVSEDAARIKLLFKPSDTVSILLGAALQNNKSHTGESAGYLASVNTPNVVSYQNVRAANQTFSAIGTSNGKFRQYWAEVNLDLGPVSVTYIPAFRTWKQNAVAYNITSNPPYNPASIPPSNPSIFQQLITTPKDRFHTQELRLASQIDGPFSWQTGVFYYKNTVVAQNRNLSYPTLAFNSLRDTTKETENIGIFAEATFAVAETVRLTGGVRQDWTNLTVDETFTRQPTNLPGTPPGTPLPPLQTRTISDKRDYRNFTYKARVEADLSPSSLLYASVSTGFLPGDVTIAQSTQAGQTLLVIQNLDTQTLTSYEIGSKNRFLDEKLQVNGSVYYYDYAGYQLGGVNIGSVPVPNLVTLVSPAKVKGGELEVAFQVTPRDRFGFNLQYTDAKFTNSPASFTNVVALRQIPNVSKWAGQAIYGHEFDLGNGNSLTFNFTGRYRSSQLLNVMAQSAINNGKLPFLKIGGQFIGDINAVLEVSDGLSLSAYVRNVTDNRFKNSAQYIAPGPPPAPQVDTTVARQYDPRTFGLVLNARF